MMARKSPTNGTLPRILLIVLLQADELPFRKSAVGCRDRASNWVERQRRLASLEYR